MPVVNTNTAYCPLTNLEMKSTDAESCAADRCSLPSEQLAVCSQLHVLLLTASPSALTATPPDPAAVSSLDAVVVKLRGAHCSLHPHRL